MTFQLKADIDYLEFKQRPELNEMLVRIRKDVTLKSFFQLQIGLSSGEAEQMQKACEIFGDEILADWDVTDEKGKAIPANAKGFQALPLQLAIAVMTAWTEQAASAGEAQGAPLDGSSLSAAELIKAANLSSAPQS